MDRRNLLVRGAGLLAFTAAGLFPQVATGGEHEVNEFSLQDVLERWVTPATWDKDNASFVKELGYLASLAFSLASIRISHPRFQYESQANFIAQVFGTLRSAFPRREGVERAISDTRERLNQDNNSSDLHESLASNLETNLMAFSQWLNRIGLNPDSPLYIDYWNAQTCFAVRAAVVAEDYNLDKFHGITVIYPYCMEGSDLVPA